MIKARSKRRRSNQRIQKRRCRSRLSSLTWTLFLAGIYPWLTPLAWPFFSPETFVIFSRQKRTFAPIHRNEPQHFDSFSAPLVASQRDACCRIKAFTSQVLDALGGPSVVDVFAVIGRATTTSSSSTGGGGGGGGVPAADCAAVRAAVSSVRVCFELDPPLSDSDDVPPPACRSLIFTST